MFGKIKWFNDDKGYGFISVEGGGPDVFAHISDLTKSGIDDPREGDRFEFDMGTGRNGRPCAQKIRRA